MARGIIITVNYGNSRDTRAMLESLAVYPGDKVPEIIIADNSPGMQEFEVLKKLASSFSSLKITLIKNEENLGYYPAAHLALSQVIETKHPQYVMVCNNDLLFHDQDFFQLLEENLSEAHVIAPGIISRNSGRNQNPHREKMPGKKEKLFYKLYYQSFYLACFLLFVRKMIKHQPSSQDRENVDKRFIFSAHGACIVFTQAYFREGGYIDKDFFLYGEEDSVAAICYEKNMKIVYLPFLKVLHDEHGSTNAGRLNRKIYRFQKQAYNYITRRYSIFR